MNYLIITLVISFIGIGVFLGLYFNKKAIIKRKFKKVPLRKISQFVHGETARTTGNVEFIGEPLIAPLSHRKCAYYHVIVEQQVSSGKSSHWKKLIEEEIMGKFAIRDGDHYAFINSNNLKTYIVQDKKFNSGFLNDASEVLERFLQKNGHKSEGFLGLNKTIRYKEGILEEGEKITLLGRGEWKIAGEVPLPGNCERILAISSTEPEPLYMSDDPDIINASN